MVAQTPMITGALPDGVRLIPLQPHVDERGALTEIFRASWEAVPLPVQWNWTASGAGVLRGMHVHVQHWDYFVLLEGHISVGLRDLRRGSPTEHATACVEIDAREPTVLVIPPRVLHGFYGRERSVWVYGLSHYFNPADELGCRWDDPALQIPWRVESPVLSQRDATAPTLAVLLEQLAQRMPG